MGYTPVISYNNTTTPYTALSSIQLIGSGYNSSILIGQSSNVFTCRIYNNFGNSATVGNAINCVLAAYDSSANQGYATTLPIQQKWLQVSVQDYNGTTTNADNGAYYPIGGTQKHPVTPNSGIISASGPNYITVNMKLVIPSSAPAQVGTIGLFLEYAWV